MSPNSKIEWIISFSRLFDAALLVPDVGHRADVVLGDERPLLEALAGQQDVGEADEQRASGSASARPRSQTNGASASATRSLCRMAKVFDIASTTTK